MIKGIIEDVIVDPSKVQPIIGNYTFVSLFQDILSLEQTRA